MTKLLLIITFTTLGCSLVWGQETRNTAPVEWKRYGIRKDNFSVSMPKMPVRFENTDACNEMDVLELWAYAEGAVYEARVVSKRGKKPPEWCAGMSRFGQATFDRRLQAASVGSLGPVENVRDARGLQVTKITLQRSTRWIFDDMAKKRWFELAITQHGGASAKAGEFLSSLVLGGNSGAIEIGAGSGVALGDLLPSSPEAPPAPIVIGQKEDVESLIIAAKKPPPYTDKARENRAEGTVKLRVTFHSNGTIGKIDILSGLPFGLTEQAIAAAKKIVFVPSKRNGIRVSIVRTIEYRFSIY